MEHRRCGEFVADIRQLRHKSLQFPRAVDNAHNLHVTFDYAVENEIGPLDEAARACRDVGPSPAEPGMARKG